MNNVIVIYLIGSSIIYNLSSGIYGIRIITQDVRTWVPNTDTPVIYCKQRLNEI